VFVLLLVLLGILTGFLSRCWLSFVALLLQLMFATAAADLPLFFFPIVFLPGTHLYTLGLKRNEVLTRLCSC